MHALERGLVEALLHGFEIDGLAAGHAARADRVSQHAQHLDARGCGNGRGSVCENFEGTGLQRVAHEDGRRFIEGAMAGGTSTAQIVVVHRRQVVVHQAVDVDQLDRGRGCIEQFQ